MKAPDDITRHAYVESSPLVREDVDVITPRHEGIFAPLDVPGTIIRT
jgi:hypothetical protein